MRKQIGIDSDAKYFKVIDLDTGEQIHGCLMADDETGEYIAYAKDKNGNFIWDKHKEERVKEHKKGRIKLVDTRTES